MDAEQGYVDSLVAEAEETLSAAASGMEAVNASRAKRGKTLAETGRDPAFAVPTEAAVLGAIMIRGRKNLPAEVAQLSVECFSQAAHAYIWTMIDACLTEGQDCDEVTVWSRVEKDPDRPKNIAYDFHCLTATCPSVINLGYWAGELVAAAQEKMQTSALAEIMANKEFDADTKAAEVQRLLKGGTKTAKTIKPLRDLLPEWVKEREAEQLDPDYNIAAKTGIPSLDSVTRLAIGEMTIIAGRPGMGKSALAGCIASYCARRAEGDVALFSLEMRSSAVISRLVTAATRINVMRPRKDFPWDQVLPVLDRLNQASLWIDDRAGLSVPEIRAALLRVPRTRLIIVDYLGLMALDKKAQRHDIAIGYNTKDLRALAKDFDAHALVLCQLSRKVEDRNPPTPVLSDLRDSGNIEEDADNVWMLYRPGYYAMRKGEKNAVDNEATIIVAKQRHGEIRSVDVKWSGQTQRFFDEDVQQSAEPDERFPPPNAPKREPEQFDWQRRAAGEEKDIVEI